MFHQLSRTRLAVLCVCACGVFAARANAADQRERIQQIVDDLRARLSITATVNVSTVESNPRLFSVTPAGQQPGTFLLSVEEDFAQALSEPEITAAVAHELGHVWLFTHFPYLQTEELANQIAARVIEPSTLAPLYDKVWTRAGADAKP